jgi:hypothetical protein
VAFGGQQPGLIGAAATVGLCACDSAIKHLCRSLHGGSLRMSHDVVIVLNLEQTRLLVADAIVSTAKAATKQHLRSLAIFLCMRTLSLLPPAVPTVVCNVAAA